MSIAGGFDMAVQEAHRCQCDCVQLFTKNNNQWRAKPITEDQVARFQRELRQRKITHPISHSSYLINLASPDRTLWRKSLDAFIIELQRAAQLGIPSVVLHPGAFTTSSPASGLRRVVRALNEVQRQTPHVKSSCLLETTAGQGSTLGWRFEQLAHILDRVRDPERLGICFDTCHVFAAGYPLGSEKEYRRTMRELNQVIGIEQIKAFHLNDSKRELGSRVDRHEHIGRGAMGLEPFRLLLNDRRFRRIPMYLETPKGTEHGTSLDVINLATLRSLVMERTKDEGQRTKEKGRRTMG
jgi:deoxyribonuclease-4